MKQSGKEKLKKFFGSVYENFVDIVFPRDITCIICGEELITDPDYAICENCCEALLKNDGKVCLICGEKIDSLANYCMNCKNAKNRTFTQARAPFLYDGEIKKLIFDLKYNHKRYIGRNLSYFLLEELNKTDWNIDVCVPIPISKKRLKQREYNQALLLCYAIKESGIPVDTENFVKSVDTPHQTELNKAERKTNLKDSFSIKDKSVFKNKNVLVIDDVYTTGSTMETASEILLKAGAKNVYCLTVAHTLPVYLRERIKSADEQ